MLSGGKFKGLHPREHRGSLGKSSVVGMAGLLLPVLFSLLSCSAKPDPNTLVMVIESSPTNLDPRVGLDAQSERIDNLIFDDLLSRGDNLNVAPGLAETWEVPDPLTYVFHLHRGVKFHDGRALTSRDVKWTFDSLLQGKIRSTKAAVYRFVDHIDTPDDSTVIFHMKEADSTLLWNMSDGAIGIVPYGSGDEMSRHPIGSGPFKFVSAETDRDVVIERNDGYWGEKAKLERVRFAVVPDATTQALELRKGSGDVAINSLTPDTVFTLARDPNLAVENIFGDTAGVSGIQLRDPILKDVRVRQAIAYALDRQAHDRISVARRGASRHNSILPPQSWAYNGDVRDVRPRADEGGSVTRCGGLSGGEWRAFSHHDEDFDRREHAPDGRGHAAAAARGGDCARHPQLRVRDIFLRRDARCVSDVWAALDRRQRRSRHFRVRISFVAVSAEWRQSELIIRIRRSTR